MPLHGEFSKSNPAGFDEGNPSSFNRYGYGNNNPYKFVDPDGRVPIPAFMAIAYVGGMAVARFSPQISQWSQTVRNTITYVTNNPTAVFVTETVAGVASGVEGSTSTIGAVGGLSGNGLKSIANNVQNLSKPDLVKALESLGLSKCGSKDGRFLHFKGKDGKLRARIDPPDTNKY